MPPAPTRDDRIEDQLPSHAARTSLPPIESNDLHPSYLLGRPPLTLDPSARPFTRRVMYDPVRDSVISSPATPTHTAPFRSSENEECKPVIPPLDAPIEPRQDLPSLRDVLQPSYDDENNTHIRARHPVLRQLAQYPERLVREGEATGGYVARRITQRPLARVPQSPRFAYENSHNPLIDRTEPSAVSGSNPDDELGAAEWSEVTGPISCKWEDGGDVEDNINARYRRSVSTEPHVDTKGKGRAVIEQSPAFRLDNLVESSVSQPQSSSTGGYEPYPSESFIEHTTSEPAYTFPGKFPPPPYIGSSSAGSSAHTMTDYLGITVSKDVDISRFLSADEFEKSVRDNPGPFTEISLSALVGEVAPNAKRARKHGTSSQRRKARGLYPQDNVPLAISTSTSKQSRYRPSGDRQPVACGYKDPITQIQCDEPFNRSVELRRHVRAVHVPAEALAVTLGQLSRSQATLLPQDWKPGDGDVLRPKCLCGKEFSRLDALRRHWTGVQAEVVDGKCISCPSSLAKKKDHAAFEQGTDSSYGTPLYS